MAENMLQLTEMLTSKLGSQLIKGRAKLWVELWAVLFFCGREGLLGSFPVIKAYSLYTHLITVISMPRPAGIDRMIRMGVCKGSDGCHSRTCRKAK